MKIRSLTLVCAILVMQHTDAADWKAPDNPDPSAILTEAEDDGRANRFDDTLRDRVALHDAAEDVDQDTLDLPVR